MKREQTNIPNIEFTTATGRYDESRSPIDLIVLHSTAGTLQSAISLFSSPPQADKETSAHYIVANDGKLYQGLEEYFTAYHCGNYNKNQRSIGIEHVDEGKDVKLHTDAQYATSCKLVADICKFYSIPCDSAHIVPHSQIVATACPNGLDVNRIIIGAQKILGTIPNTDDCLAKLTQITAERDRLNGIIEGKDKSLSEKDAIITNLNQQINQKNANMATLEVEKKSLADQLTTCQNTSQLHLEQANKSVEYKQQVDHLESQKAEWLIKEQEYIKQIKTLQTRNDNLKKPVQKLILAMCDKLGIQI